jgi:hypothetical protein
MALGISARQHRGDGDVLGCRIGREERFLGWLLEAVLHQQVQVITLVEDLALHVRVKLLEPACLAVLLGYEFLVEGRDLDI